MEFGNETSALNAAKSELYKKLKRTHTGRLELKVPSNCLYTEAVMPRKSPAQRPSAAQSETFGQRLARLRKERGWTQVELAERIGIIQSLISDYERDRLRMNPAMILRFAAALEITTDELLQSDARKHPLRRKPSLRVLRRLEKIEKLLAHQQSTLLKTIDTFLRGASVTR
jgi:transcriptional regulator with XRE-family HTH domain